MTQHLHLLLVLTAVLWCADAFRRLRAHVATVSVTSDPQVRSQILLYWSFTLVLLTALAVHWYNLLVNVVRAWN